MEPNLLPSMTSGPAMSGASATVSTGATPIFVYAPSNTATGPNASAASGSLTTYLLLAGLGLVAWYYMKGK